MRKTSIARLVIFAVLIPLSPRLSEAAIKTVNCNVPGTTIQAMIKKLNPGDTLRVSGICSENVNIPEEIERITIDGQGTATINGTDTTRATVAIRGRNVVLTGFLITGGEDGVGLTRGGTATISGSTIQGALRNGVGVGQGSSARITNSTIQNNGNNGVNVVRNSFVRLGFLTLEGADTIPGGVGPNTIQNNAQNGVRVAGSSNADIVDNTITNNTESGVRVVEVSHALVASNTIDGNLEDGITVGQNSGVNLGRATGTDLDELPNGTSANNTDFGIRCFINSYADGRLGTLNGNSGATSFPAGCIDSLDP
jgi:parallel beta-helix repeat protein